MRAIRRRSLALAATACACVTAVTVAVPSAGATNAKHGRNAYQQTILIADEASTGAALTDPTLVNPWGLALGPTTPLWVVKEGTNLTTVYRGANGVDPLSPLFDVRLVPAPTGIVFNPTDSFLVPGTSTPARFIFDSLSGFISAWTNSLPLPTTDTPAVTPDPSDPAAFTGLAIAPETASGPRLYAADAASGQVRVYDGQWQQVGAIADRRMPPWMAPYGVQVIGDRLYVTFAPPEEVEHGLKGAIDVFTLDGQLVKRLATGGPLDAPWGMALAPTGWGPFGGDLLVGNEDSGTIDAFDPVTGHFEGVLSGPDGQPIVDEGLWGLTFGNGVTGTPSTLLVAAGIDDYEHGIVAAITPAG